VSAFGGRNVPRDCLAYRWWAKSAFDQHVVHRAGRVSEHAELAAAQTEEQVLSPNDDARQRVAGRVAEHDLFAGVVGGGGEQFRVVGVAADHPMQDDDVRGFDLVRCGGDIDDAPLRPLGQTGVGE
jgi:hypothetical protein